MRFKSQAELAVHLDALFVKNQEKQRQDSKKMIYRYVCIAQVALLLWMAYDTTIVSALIKCNWCYQIIADCGYVCRTLSIPVVICHGRCDVMDTFSHNAGSGIAKKCNG